MQRKPAVTDFPIAPVLAERWSPRALAEREIPQDLLGGLLEAARWAPSASNLQPWRFVVARRGSETFAKLAGTLVGFNAAWAPKAPILILSLASVAADKTPSAGTWLDVGLAQSMLLVQAASAGLVTHVMAGFDRPAATAAFAAGPHEEAVVVTAVAWPGDPAELSPELLARETAARTRKPLAEIVAGDVEGLLGGA